MGKIGVLLVNLGSPDAPETAAVRRYLQEFLWDGRVIDIPALPRWLLVYGIISLFRAPKSAHAYQQVWGPRGSPLVAAGYDLTQRVGEILGENYVVRLAMRYGRPSMEDEIKGLLAQGVTALHVLPLYPQYASATTGSTVEELMRVLKPLPIIPELRVIGDFYEHPPFIKAFGHVARKALEGFAADHVLLSFHGLPERQLVKTDPSHKHCLKSLDCCREITDKNRHCYRAQCLATTRALQAELGLNAENSSASFQSRLGRATWIQPYTEEEFEILRKRGVKRLAVLCPAFVADCLETLEEIAMRGAESWKLLGGEDFKMVPSLNAEEFWCHAVADMVR